MDTRKLFSKMSNFLRTHFPEKGETFDFEDYIHAYGKASDALIYSTIFMPELIVLNDSVLIKSNVESDELKASFLSSIRNSDSVSKIEASFNFIEVIYLFGSYRNISNLEESLLAHRIRDAWDGWLKIQFPKRRFIVEVLSSKKTGSNVGVHFFQKR